jgi:hypothetical protein
MSKTRTSLVEKKRNKKNVHVHNNIICVTLSKSSTKPNKELNEISPKKVIEILFVSLQN